MFTHGGAELQQPPLIPPHTSQFPREQQLENPFSPPLQCGCSQSTHFLPPLSPGFSCLAASCPVLHLKGQAGGLACFFQGKYTTRGCRAQGVI